MYNLLLFSLLQVRKRRLTKVDGSEKEVLSPSSSSSSGVRNESKLSENMETSKSVKSPTVVRSSLESAVSTEAKVSRTLTVHLNQIFLLADSGNTSSSLSVSSISEMICMRLGEGQEVGGAIGYLTGCYKRLCQKVNVEKNEKIKEELDKARQQIVSFISSSLATPELFGVNSAESVSDMLKFVALERSSICTALLKDVTEELVLQGCFEEVRNHLQEMNIA